MTAPIGFLGGATILGTGTASWSLREGTSYVQSYFDMQWGDAEGLLKQGLKPLTLTLSSGEAPMNIGPLYALEMGSSGNPKYARIRVVDRRWFWNTEEISLAYNVRRRVGINRLQADNSLKQNDPIADTISYWPWSMRGGSLPGHTPVPWTAFEILEDITARIGKLEEAATGQTVPFVFSPGTRSHLKEIPAENLFLNGDLATCLAQLLDHFPGVGVFVTATGDVKFYNKTSGEESKMIEAAGPEKINQGHIVSKVSFANVRPREIEVCFHREVELRFDFTETVAGYAAQPDDRYMQNVLPIPDFELTVRLPDGSSRKMAQGQWITFDQALAAWNTTQGSVPGGLPLVKGGLRPLTYEHLQRACIPWNGVAEAIGILGLATPDIDWSGRIMAAISHYRRTYRINPRWMGRIFRLSATRVGTLDFTTGTRGKATIYSDYSFLGTRRSLYRSAAGGKDLSFVDNVPCFGNTPEEPIIPRNRGTPGTVDIIDQDQGIIRFDYLTDIANVYNTVFPSQVEINGDNTVPGSPARWAGPTGDLTIPAGRPSAFDILDDPTKFPKLLTTHRAAVVMTAQPGPGGFPLDTGVGVGQFHVEKVKPTDVPAFIGQGACNGPKLRIVIGANYETARVAWVDARVHEIEAAFGINPEFAGGRLLGGMTLNAADGNALVSGGASLPLIARAAAQRIWLSLADRAVGSMTGTLVPSIEPAGWLSEVTHSLEPSGEGSTQLAVPDRVDPLRLEAYLEAGTRRMVMRLANPGG